MTQLIATAGWAEQDNLDFDGFLVLVFGLSPAIAVAAVLVEFLLHSLRQIRPSRAVFLRTATLVCSGLGWYGLVRSARPAIVFFVITAAGASLAIIVGRRRRRRRLMTACWFLLGIAGLAVFSNWTANCFQSHSEPQQQLDFLVFLVLSPYFGVLLLILLRAWTWSAHDQAIRVSLASQSGDCRPTGHGRSAESPSLCRNGR